MEDKLSIFLNNNVKFCSQFLTFIYILIGLLCIGYGLYIVFLPWGNSNRDAYQATGICMTLFGSCLVFISYLGYLSTRYQTRKYGTEQKWTGRTAIIIYNIYLAGLLTLLIIIYFRGQEWINSIDNTIEELEIDSNSNPSYTFMEASIRDYFNSLFFYASTHCSDDYTWYWMFVNDHCSAQISQSNCERCSYYSVTLCQADENTCYSSNSGSNYACPYTICRENTLDFIYNKASSIFGPIVFALACITIIVILLNTFLILHSDTSIDIINNTHSSNKDNIQVELVLLQQHTITTNNNNNNNNSTKSLNDLSESNKSLSKKEESGSIKSADGNLESINMQKEIIDKKGFNEVSIEINGFNKNTTNNNTTVTTAAITTINNKYNILRKEEEDELIANFIAMNEKISSSSDMMPMEEPMEEINRRNGKYSPLICAPPLGSSSTNSQSPRHQQQQLQSSRGPSPYYSQEPTPSQGYGRSPRHAGQYPSQASGRSPRHAGQHPSQASGRSPRHAGQYPSQASGRSPRHAGQHPSQDPSPSEPYPSSHGRPLRNNESSRPTPTFHTTSSMYEINLEIAMAESLEVVSFKSNEEMDLERAIEESQKN